jgi:predicted porin
MLRKGNLDFRILHRFGFVDAGIKQFFGLDEASMRISFDYGISNDFSIGVGRSTYRKEIDLFGKVRLLQQSTGAKAKPLSLALAAGAMTWTEESFATPKPDFADRSSWYLQLLAGRKFTSKFSMQLSPIVLHSNMPISGTEKTLFALGAGGRYKFSKRMAFTLDYQHVLNGLTASNTNPLSAGIDIETGGHVFQLHFSNSTGMNERAYLSETYGKFFKGEIRFGFNLSRMFQLGKR